METPMYIDPGIGSMVIQALIAAVVAAGGTIVVFRGKVRSMFERLRNRKKERKETDESH